MSLTPTSPDNEAVIDPLKSAGGPAIGLPPIDFLTAGSVVGEFNAIVAPGLNEINPNLAVEVEYHAGGARLSFVPIKLDIEFDDTGNDGTPEWQEVISWRNTGGGAAVVPQTVHDLSIVNNVVGTPQELTVDNNGQVGRLTIGGGTDSLTVMVGDGGVDADSEVLSSLTTATVTTNGVLCLHDGELAATSAAVTGGVIEGSGLINLSNLSGAQAGMLTVSQGSLSPGMNITGDEVGELDINGDYTQGSEGTFAIDITGSNNGGANHDNHDFVDVSGAVILEGLLQVDASELMANESSVGNRYEILRAGTSLSGEFDDVVITSSGGKVFRILYEEIPGALISNGELAALASGSSYSAYLVEAEPGDASGDGTVDGIDAQAFAAAILDLTLGFNYIDNGPQRVSSVNMALTLDFTGDGHIDLDDIQGFVDAYAIFNSVSTATAFEDFSAAFAQVENSLAVPEPTSTQLYLLAVITSLCGKRRIR